MATGGTRLESLAQLETVCARSPTASPSRPGRHAALPGGRGASRWCRRKSLLAGPRVRAHGAVRGRRRGGPFRSSGCPAAEHSPGGARRRDHLLASGRRAKRWSASGPRRFRGRPRPLRDQRLPGHHRPQAGGGPCSGCSPRREKLLAESLDYEQTLRRLAEIAVPRLGDWCMVYTAAPDGSISGSPSSTREACTPTCSLSFGTTSSISTRRQACQA